MKVRLYNKRDNIMPVDKQLADHTHARSGRTAVLIVLVLKDLLMLY